MSAVTTSPPTTRSAGTRTALTAASLVGALASAGYIAGLFLLSGLSTAEAQSAPLTITECLLAGLAYVVVAVTLPGLAGATRLPRWALSVAAVGCAFIAIQAWSYGTFGADLANRLPSEQFEQLSKDVTFLFQLMFVPMGLICLVGFVALAVVGWRWRAMSRGACVLFVLAGLVSLLGPFPPVGLLAGLAVAWTARSAQPTGES